MIRAHIPSVVRTEVRKLQPGPYSVRICGQYLQGAAALFGHVRGNSQPERGGAVRCIAEARAVINHFNDDMICQIVHENLNPPP